MVIAYRGFTEVVSRRFFHDWNPDRLFMIWTGYIDETETHGAPLMILGGFLSTAERWAAFDKDWALLLDSHNLPYSHAYDLVHKNPPFGGWGSDRHNDFILGARELMNRHAFAGFSAVIRRDDYRTHYRSQEKPRRIPEDTMYGVLLRACISFSLAVVAREFGEDNVVNFVLEAGGVKPGYAEQIYAAMKNDHVSDPLFRAMLGPVIGFAKKKECPGCQAADLMIGGALQLERQEHGKEHSIIERSSFADATMPFDPDDAPTFRIPVSREVLTSLRERMFVEERLRREWAENYFRDKKAACRRTCSLAE